MMKYGALLLIFFSLGCLYSGQVYTPSSYGIRYIKIVNKSDAAGTLLDAACIGDTSGELVCAREVHSVQRTPYSGDIEGRLNPEQSLGKPNARCGDESQYAYDMSPNGVIILELEETMTMQELNSVKVFTLNDCQPSVVDVHLLGDVEDDNLFCGNRDEGQIVCPLIVIQ